MAQSARGVAAFAWLPLPVLAGALALAWALDPPGSYPAVALLIGLQLVFMTGASLAVVTFVGRAFLVDGTLGLLLLAAGAVCFGLAGVLANVLAPGNVNLTVTIHNLCVWCSAACHFAGILLVRQRTLERGRAPALAAAILGALLLVALSAAIALQGWAPVFFVQGQGGTPARQMVLGTAVLLFALAGASLWREAAAGAAPAYRRWYALGLLLFGLGLLGVLVQRVHSGVVGWIGVATQLLGGVYLFAAAWQAMHASQPAVSLSTPPRSAPMRYALAAAFVLAAAAFRLALLERLGTSVPFILFFPAVVLAALYCGAGPAALATLLAALLADLWWVEPVGVFGLFRGDHWLETTLFLANCGVLIVVAELLRRAQRRSVIAETESAAAHERELVAGELEAGRVKLDRALAAARMVAWEYDTRTDRVSASDNLAELYGLVPGTQVHQAAAGFALVLAEDVARHRAVVQWAIDEGSSYVSLFRIVRPLDGQTLWIEERGCAVAGADGRTARLVGTSSDVTERQLAEERLRASEQRYRVLFESMDQGFCIIEMLFDAQGQAHDYRFIEVNPAFEKHTGLVGAQGRTALELVPGLEPFWPQTYGRVARTGEAARFIDHSQAMAGRWFDVYAFRVGEPGDARVAILFTEISERVRASAERDAALVRLREQDARKDEFLATLAHELRNPLAPLRSGLRLLGLARSDAQAQDKARAMMQRQVDQLVRLIDDLLDIARVNRGKVVLQREPVALADVVQRAVEISLPLVEAGSHELVLELPQERALLDADAVRLAQVFSNLLNNAAKYSERGGRIVLSAAVEKDRVVVRVRDQGIGLSGEMLTRVFEPFTQADPTQRKSQGGLGIGLTLARRLVELHGGSIEAASDGPGRGSTFTVVLPLLTAPLYEAPGPAAPAAAAVALAPPEAGKRLLVADDNVDAADTLSELLRMGGHEVRTVYDGAAAVAQCEAWQPDVVLLDLGMPQLGGLEACRRIRAQPWGQRALIVALTGWGDEQAQAQCRDAGFDAHLVKPVDDAQLQRVLGAATES